VAGSSTTPVEDEPTLLRRQLDSRLTPATLRREGSRSNALDALRLARRRFLRGQRVDMGAIALELGVNRVTLYRWVGSRERLLVEVVWSLADTTLQREGARTRKYLDRIIGEEPDAGWAESMLRLLLR
jgi:hypothetical protein